VHCLRCEFHDVLLPHSVWQPPFRAFNSTDRIPVGAPRGFSCICAFLCRLSGARVGLTGSYCPPVATISRYILHRRTKPFSAKEVPPGATSERDEEPALLTKCTSPLASVLACWALRSHAAAVDGCARAHHEIQPRARALPQVPWNWLFRQVAGRLVAHWRE
jgi:hypothetical protein